MDTDQEKKGHSHAEAYIIDALRSPTGRRNGGLATIHGADLGAHVIKALVERNGIADQDYIVLFNKFSQVIQATADKPYFHDHPQEYTDSNSKYDKAKAKRNFRPLKQLEDWLKTLH